MAPPFWYNQVMTSTPQIRDGYLVDPDKCDLITPPLRVLRAEDAKTVLLELQFAINALDYGQPVRSSSLMATLDTAERPADLMGQMLAYADPTLRRQFARKHAKLCLAEMAAIASAKRPGAVSRRVFGLRTNLPN